MPSVPGAYPWKAFERWARPMRAAAVGQACPRCGVTMGSGSANPRGVTVDHIVPLAMGGTHSKENLRVLCRRCNSGLGGKLAQARKAARAARRRPRVPGGVFGPLSS